MKAYLMIKTQVKMKGVLAKALAEQLSRTQMFLEFKSTTVPNALKGPPHSMFCVTRWRILCFVVDIAVSLLFGDCTTYFHFGKIS
mmetsp:Transcript_3884/g.4852  ORF Transcript_3884/g.4852 Transcript_3884/m.4852 type:complete len:85 (-) Transcript_3884:529-783(-)